MTRSEIKAKKKVRKKPKFTKRKPRKTYRHDDVNMEAFPNPTSAKRLRTTLLNNTTKGESRLYKILSCIGIHYIKQYPIYTKNRLFYADAYIPELNLIIEVDGGYHNNPRQKKQDAIREAILIESGYVILRYDNYAPVEDIATDIKQLRGL